MFVCYLVLRYVVCTLLCVLVNDNFGTVFHFSTDCRYDLFTSFTPLIESHTTHAPKTKFQDTQKLKDKNPSSYMQKYS